MRNMNNSQQTITIALEELGGELGISEADGGSKLKIDLPLVTRTGPLGEVSVVPPQVELSEFKLGPRLSGEPSGASKLDWPVFTKAAPENQRERSKGKGSR